MQSATDSGVSTLPGHHAESVGLITSELAVLRDRVQASITLLETTTLRDRSPAMPEHVGPVVVLDEVAPRYAKASEALVACNSSLDAALRFLRDAETSAPLTKSAPQLVLLSTRR